MLIVYMVFSLGLIIVVNSHAKSNKSVCQQRQWFTMQTVLLIVLLSSCYLLSMVNPLKTWDLYRHYLLIDNMRAHGIDYVWTVSWYRELPVINFLYYIISIVGRNELLPLICLTVDVIVLYRILNDQILKCVKPVSSTRIIGTLIVAVPLINFVMALSGIRNVLSMSLSMYALYMLIYLRDQKHSRTTISAVILFAISAMIHQTSVIIPVLYLLSKIKHKKFICVAMLCWGLFYNTVQSSLSTSGISYLETVGSMLYTSSGSYSPDWRVESVYFFITLIVLILALHKDPADDEKMKKWKSYTVLYVVLMIGSIGSLLIYERLLYGLAYLAIPLVINRSNAFKDTQPLLWALYTGGLIELAFQLYKIFNVVTRGY